MHQGKFLAPVRKVTSPNGERSSAIVDGLDRDVVTNGDEPFRVNLQSSFKIGILFSEESDFSEEVQFVLLVEVCHPLLNRCVHRLLIRINHRQVLGKCLLDLFGFAGNDLQVFCRQLSRDSKLVLKQVYLILQRRHFRRNQLEGANEGVIKFDGVFRRKR